MGNSETTPNWQLPLEWVYVVAGIWLGAVAVWATLLVLWTLYRERFQDGRD